MARVYTGFSGFGVEGCRDPVEGFIQTILDAPDGALESIV